MLGRLAIRLLYKRAHHGGALDLVCLDVGKRVDAAGKFAGSADERARSNLATRLGVGGHRGQVSVKPLNTLGRQHVLEGGLRDLDERRIGEAGLEHHRMQVRAHAFASIIVDPVQHHDYRQVARRRALEELPGERIRVPCRRRDEHPQVGGSEQLRGQGAVGVVDAVEVWSIEQGEPLGHGIAGQDAHGILGSALAPSPVGLHACEARQDARIGEPVGISGVADDERLPGRRADDAGSTHASADEAIHERRLACPRRTADHR